MLLYSFGLSVSYMGVIGTEVAVLARLTGSPEAASFSQAARENLWFSEQNNESIELVQHILDSVNLVRKT